MMRLGVMGGMFDPVHRGHLVVARAAVSALSLDRLHLVPCATPNHREGAAASGAQRTAMLELATASEPNLVVDDRELQRTGVSYSVDTLRDFHHESSDAALVFVLGWDSFLTLPHWHRWQDLFTYAHLCTVSRPGVAWPPSMDDADGRALRKLLTERSVPDPEALFERTAGSVYVVENIEQEVSSTKVRNALQEGQSTGEWIAPAVTEYIARHGLYCN